MPHSGDEGISVEYDAFSSVEIVLGFFKIKDLYKSYYYWLPVLVPWFLYWYFPKVIFIKLYTVTLLTLHVFVFVSVGALSLRNVPGKRFCFDWFREAGAKFCDLTFFPASLPFQVP